MRQSDVWKPILAPLAVAFIIITVFSVAKTHLLPYILPAFPFLALFIAVLGQRVATAFKIGPYVSILIAVPFIFTGFMYNLHSYANSNLPGVPDEKEIGIAYRSQHDDIPLYTLEWPFLETLNYYGDTKVQALSAAAHSGKEIKGPFYLVTNAAGASYFYVIRYGEVVTPYDHMRLVYQGKMLALLYFDSDTVLPEFSVPR
jgi:hypothetical protein